MERHLDERTIIGPIANLFAGLSENISETNAGLVLPTADELREPLPRVRIVGEMFGKSK